MDIKPTNLPPSTYGKSSCISKLLFLWVVPLFYKGYKKDLTEDDLCAVPEATKAEQLGNKLEKLWISEINRAKRLGKSPSLLRVYVKMCWKTMTAVTVLFLLNNCILLCAQPIFLRLLIMYFENDDSKPSQAYFFAGAICLISFLNTLNTQPGIFLTMYIGMKLRVASSSLIYRKSIQLSKNALQKTNCGQIINLLSNDCGLFDIHFNFLPYFIVAPIQVSILVVLMYQEVGPTCLAGVVFIAMLLPFQYFLGKYSAVFRLRLANRTDQRGRLMNEILFGMKVIKQYAWEIPFSLLVQSVRKLEVKQIRNRGLLRGTHQAVFTFAPKLIQYLTFVLFVLTRDEPLTADKVFFTLTCLHTMTQITVHFMPLAAAGVGELTAATKRIQDFLLLDEKQLCKQNIKPMLSCLDIKALDNVKPDNAYGIYMNHVNASWTNNDNLALQDISFSAKDDQLVIIVGPVGSSKSTLLLSILQEIAITSGSLNISGSVSYASQEPWIFAGNLRQNILFGLPYDEIHYHSTIKACCLDMDLKQLPQGDMTVVGERGAALSGGQKARVNLARAIYRKSNIYLLDDPLSAVDARVSRKLFENCIKNQLAGTLRILVTHQLQYLSQADYIVVMNQGKVQAQGRFQDLIEEGVDFFSLMTQGEVLEENDSKRASLIPNCLESKENVSQQTKQTTPNKNQEKQTIGSVSLSTYKEYFLTGHSKLGIFFLGFAFVSCQLVTSGNDYWLSYWTNAEDRHHDFLQSQFNSTTANGIDDNYFGKYTYLYVYSALVLLLTAFSLWRSLWFFRYCAQTSVHIHHQMFQSLVRAPISFFDKNPSGRILNRLTKDLGTIDELLPPTVINTFSISLQVIGVLVVIIISNCYMAAPTGILLVVMLMMRRIFVRTAGDIKRIEAVARSPIFSHVVTTIEGLLTIRVCGVQPLLITQFEGYQDLHSVAWFIFLGINRCFGMWLELLCDSFLVFVSFSFLLISSSTQGGNVGLAISSLLTIMGTFQWGMRQSAEMENYMTSVERAQEYSKLGPEANLKSHPDMKPKGSWPLKGKIEFSNVSLSYQNNEPVLKNLTFEIQPFKKVGIVGRTGAGKSSIVSTLFRLTEPEGNIFIDGIDIQSIGLHDLRKNISLIPQDPVLFSGTVRFNLDPFNRFSDNDLWEVIKDTELTSTVQSLDSKIEDGGANFSVGQRQLICLARAILRKNRILIMDEATANIDHQTDLLIQNTTRSNFVNCTIIIIAHRLQTIMDCDKVLVLDHGQIKEYDHPHKLLQSHGGFFNDMVEQTGKTTSAMLRKISESAFQLTGDI